MTSDTLFWLEAIKIVMLLGLIILMARALFRLRTIEDHQAQELVRTNAMVDTVTGAAMKVTTQTSAIAERLAVVTEKAANQAAEESALRHKVLGADLSLVLKATHDLAEQLTKKIEQPVLTSTIHEATHELAEELGKKIDAGVEKAEASYHAANNANEKILELTQLVAGQQQQSGAVSDVTAPVVKVIAGVAPKIDSIEKTVEATHEIVKGALPAVKKGPTK
jgi:hypothetical protein